MNELINKISSYNLFNYLLPGIVFVVMCEYFTRYSLKQPDLLIGLFFYYFIGLVISRIGSVVVEPLLQKIKFIKYCSHENYVWSTKKDQKIDTLLEVNNMYRTMTSMFLCLFAIKCLDWITAKYPASSNFVLTTLVISVLVLFAFSFRKQTNYIKKRVEIACKDKDD